MPLTLPNLDDRRFDDLMAEARALIPSLAPEWTNHNPTDPGITLIELFAWLNEILMYRINRVTVDNKRAFLKLLNGPDWRPSADGDLERDLRETILALRQIDRAITPADFAALARAADPRVARVTCIENRNLSMDPLVEVPGHISLVVVPTSGGVPPSNLLSAIATYLDTRLLLTTRLHVVAPRLVPIRVRLTLNLEADAMIETVRSAAVAALLGFLHPLTGGEDGTGWPFGRPVFVSQIYRLLGRIPGVDYVSRSGTTNEISTDDTTRILTNDVGELIGVDMAAHDLPEAMIDPQALTLVLPLRR